MNSSKNLGLVFLAPALVLVVLFFFVPVILTGVFSFTTMSTATGISGGSYQVTPNALQILRDKYGLGDLAQELGKPHYVVDKQGLAALAKESIPPAVITELRADHLSESFASRRLVERMIRGLDNRPSIRQIKRISEHFSQSLANARYASADALLAAAEEAHPNLGQKERDALLAATYTGWTWTADNFRRMVSAPDSMRYLVNTVLYVGLTLVLFNTGFAMVLAITTFFMPERPAGLFRILWLVPRISPPVIFVLLWKWLAWDTGFLSTVLTNFGVQPRNWMLDTGFDAWLFVILINGFVGASMGMLIFSSAIRAIPSALFHAASVDGAYRWQQVRHIILPQLRWPILFVTCYQTLSLLTSFEYILLSTNGGPGSSTEVWSLAIYHTALSNYAGNQQYGYGAAMALVLVIIGIVLSLIYLRLFNYRTLVTKPKIEH